jgi:hypothetical protein
LSSVGVSSSARVSSLSIRSTTLEPCALKDHILGPDEVLLMSDYSLASFDSRYFGPLPRTSIQSCYYTTNDVELTNEEERTELTPEESIDQKLQDAETPGYEVSFDPDEAEKLAFRDAALSDEDARDL